MMRWHKSVAFSASTPHGSGRIWIDIRSGFERHWDIELRLMLRDGMEHSRRSASVDGPPRKAKEAARKMAELMAREWLVLP